MAADLGPNAVPDRIAIDAHGYGWRVWDDTDMWSMVPQNPDNTPTPKPLTWFVKEDGGIVRDVLVALCERDGLSLDSEADPGTPARNYELAMRLGIGQVFGV